MARKISVMTTDDLDGSPGAETVSFGLDGVSYEIDLASANKTRLADAVAPYVAADRRSAASVGGLRASQLPGASTVLPFAPGPGIGDWQSPSAAGSALRS